MRKFAFVLILASMTAIANAADLARLEWGGFVVDNDSSSGTQDWKAAASDDGHAVTMTFSALEAKADGATPEGKADFSGFFDISQPATDNFGKFHIDLTGYIIKSPSATARLTLKIGNAEKTIEWTDATALSEKFTKSFDIIVPGGGRLPDPFPVSAEAIASKTATGDSVFLSLNTLRIEAANPSVAAK